jgi:pimeloyl-ACP methyl ester carboxylesterase
VKTVVEENTGHYVEVNGIKMYYEDFGAGTPLILIHGGFSNARFNWGPHYPLLSEHFRVIAPDCRGQGNTDNPSKEFSYKLMCDDIIALIRKLTIYKPIVCGWSDGGQIALELGINYSDELGGIIAGGVLCETSDYYLDFMKSMGVNGPGDVDIDKLTEKFPAFVEAAPEMHSGVYGRDYWKELLTNISKMWTNPDEFPGVRISKISVPTLILQGDRDEAASLEDALRFHRDIPQAELAVFPNADHGSIITQAEKYATVITDFINRITEEPVS